jgi:hypothetical protein
VPLEPHSCGKSAKDRLADLATKDENIRHPVGLPVFLNEPSVPKKDSTY